MNKDANNSFRLPAEWEPQSAIILMWPHKDTDWVPYLSEITETYIQLSHAITSYEDLLIIARDTAAVKGILEGRLQEQQLARITFFEGTTNDTWARDVSPITLTDGKDFHLLDFKFNGWGEKFAADLDNAINKKLYDSDIYNGTLLPNKDFVLEGGSIESDGQGTLFTTTGCLMASHRNQPLTKQEIEQQLKERIQGIERVVWLNHGELEGDDTDGHIDTTVRIAPNNTLLYIACEDRDDSHYQDFKALEEELKALRTTDGAPYRLLRLPFTTPITEEGERLPATYANFLVLNNAVIVPTYRQPENDRRAMRTVQEAFPDREVIGIDACTIIRQHGSIHCLTMQLPKGVLGK